MPKIHINSVNYWFELKNETKSGNPALLLIHGFAGNRTRLDFIWNSDTFNEYPLFRIDLKGHGESQKENITNYSLDSCVVEINQFITDIIIGKYGIRQIIIAAHSMGGIIAQKIAITQPNYLYKLILLCTVSETSKSYKVLTFFGSKFFPLMKNILKKNIKKSHLTVGIENFPEWSEENSYLKPDDKALKGYLVELNEVNISDNINKINVPTLIIGGINDKFSTPDLIYTMDSKIPDSKYIIYENTGHFPYIPYKNEIIKEINDFIGEK